MLDVLIRHPEENPGKRKIIRFSHRADKPVKSVLKAISWRIIGTLDTMVISYFITGKITAAVTIGSVEVITKTFLYYFHERIWAHIHRLRLRLRFNVLNRHYGRRIKYRRTKDTAKRIVDYRIIKEHNHSLSR